MRALEPYGPESHLIEGLSDISFQLPVHGPPHLQAAVVCLGGDVLPNRVPRQPLHQTSVALQGGYNLWGGKRKKQA